MTHRIRLPGTLEVECRSCANFSFAWGRFSCEIMFLVGNYGQYANIHTVSIYITGHADRYAANADTLNLLSFLRLILLSCTTYSYVYLVWLLFWQESREQQKNFEEHAKTQADANSRWNGKLCKKWVQCRTHSYSFLIVYVSQESQLTYFLLVTLLAGEVFERKSYRVARGSRSG